MLRQQSLGCKDSTSVMLRADAIKLAWVSGTNLGLEVVPEVCKSKAMSWGPEQSAAVPLGTPVADKVNAPAGPWGTDDSSTTFNPQVRAANRTGEGALEGTITTLARKSPRSAPLARVVRIGTGPPDEGDRATAAADEATRPAPARR
jgi:hypothetical protein